MIHSMDQVLRISELSPFLIPAVDFRLWSGTVIFEGQEIPVTISTPNFPSLQDYSVMCPIAVKEDVAEKLTQFNILAEEKKDNLLQLLDFFRNEDPTVDKRSGTKEDKGRSWSSRQWIARCSQVLRELRQLGHAAIMACAPDLTDVTLTTQDVQGVEHRMVVGLSSGWPHIVDADLPEVAIVQLNQAKTIIEMYNMFQTTVDSLQDFWKNYDSLTRNTWVIDPEHPQRKDVHCRIIIGDNVSMVITLNPQDINTCPDIKFLGPDNTVAPIINSMEDKLKTRGWDEELSMLDNLQTLLGLEAWPRRDLQCDTASQHAECDICFIARLNHIDGDTDTLPVKVCNNSKCRSAFHISCLAQWFQAVPTNETSFNLISGDCPSCGQKILCPVKMS